MENKELIKQIVNEYGLSTREDISAFSMMVLTDAINELLNNDFQKLISILYRMDINEVKLRLLLKDNPGSDAAMIIANLMIDRQAQKIKSRQEFRRDSSISDEESW